MKISSLKSSLAFHKTPRESGLLPYLQNMMHRYAAVIGEMESFISGLKGGDERELSCEEELLIGRMLFDAQQQDMDGYDWHFVQQLKVSLFANDTTAQYFDRKVEWAERVFANAKQLPVALLQPAYVNVVKRVWDCRGAVMLLNALFKAELLDSETAGLVETTTCDREELAKQLPKLGAILSKDVIKGLSQSEKNLTNLIEAYQTLNAAGVLNPETMKLVNECHCGLGEMVGAFCDLHNAGALKPELNIFALLNKADRYYGRRDGNVTLLAQSILRMAKEDVLTCDSVEVLSGNIYAGQELIDAFVKMKHAGIFTSEYVQLMVNRQVPDDIAAALVILQEADLLRSNLKTLQNCCYNHQLREPLEKFREIGLVKQYCLDLILGLDPNYRAEVVIMLGKAGLATEENCAAIKATSFNNFYQFYGDVKAFFDANVLNQAQFDLILRNEVPHAQRRLLHNAHRALQSLSLLASAIKKDEVLQEYEPQAPKI